MCTGLTSKLVILACAAVGALLLAEVLFSGTERRSDTEDMNHAAELTDRWFQLVRAERETRGFNSAFTGQAAYPGVLGVEWSEITTTLGSLDAKIAAANPAFAALLVRLFHDAGVTSSSIVGVALSGSFPSLGIATLAALQTIGADAVIVSSIGASSFGANDTSATWPDMEAWLRRKGSLRFASSLVTPGGEEDNGSNFTDEGRAVIERAVRRSGAILTIPSDYTDALHRRLDLFDARRIDLFVNIGGNQTSLGLCAHGPGIPNGLSRSFPSCGDSTRGLLMRMVEKGIPVIHLLNIRSLADTYGLPLVPSRGDRFVLGVRQTSVERKSIAAFLCGVLLVGVWWAGRTRSVFHIHK